ncbi:hypothetical protein C8R46DRAFT_1233782 [Mycena filopes]|nr:hypothetical protein C8R46DRAFT_1233782 [Mycena filopes]
MPFLFVSAILLMNSAVASPLCLLGSSLYPLYLPVHGLCHFESDLAGLLRYAQISPTLVQNVPHSLAPLLLLAPS